MPQWLPSTLRRIRRLAASGNVRFTLKSLRELAELELGLDEMDACTILVGLKAGDSAGRLRSEGTGEWLYDQAGGSDGLRRHLVSRAGG